ncbi:fatty acid desaturase [mine drainage metagenome]|jgi:stearoyl-CoA desaturase (delta-9 desaturase)|uniref:Fatty acid desaturase n=1 Tax=mine drainage metagenome TaxID=410659 RepID=A0A1J5R8E1_9ZZZZ
MLETILNTAAHGLLNANGWEILAYAALTTHLTIVSVTIFLHRAQAHRALELHPAVAHVFRFWLWLSTGMVTREWVAIHRKHHARCETDEDPHSPVSRGLRTVLLRGSELYRAEARNAQTLAQFGQGTPDDWIERRVYSRYIWQGVGTLLVADVLMFGALGATVWAVQMLWIPIWAAGVVNGLGHFFGYRNYASRDRSHNLLPWGLLIGGEELHNNHHTYPTSAKLSLKWWEFDIGWMYISVLRALRLARPRKLPPKARIGALRGQVDVALLHTVIANRYDLMARYARALRGALRHELRAGGSRTLLRAARRVIGRDRDMLDANATALLDEVARRHPLLGQLLRMREELKTVWEHSSASAEQLRAQLQDWCQRAEHSGIGALRELSLSLRSYA